MAARLPPGVYESEEIRSVYLPNGNDPNLMHHTNMNGEHQLKVDSNGPNMPLPSAVYSTHPNGTSAESYASADARNTNEIVTVPQNRGVVSSHQPEDNWNTRGHKANGDKTTFSNRVEVLDGREQAHLHNVENGSKSRSPSSATTNNQVEAEWIEQYEPGVYITLVALRDGTRDLKRVRFSRRRFGEHQAEAWWSENRENVYEKYNVRGSDRASSVASTQSAFRPDDFSSSSRA